MSKRKQLINHLSGMLRERFIPAHQTNPYSSKYYLGIVYAKTAGEISNIIQLCIQYDTCIVQQQKIQPAFLEKQFIILCCDKINHIDISEDRRTVKVGVGVETSELIRFLEFRKLVVPPISRYNNVILLDLLNDFSLNCVHTYAYGSLGNFILGVEGVLGSGEIVQFGSNNPQPVFSDIMKQILLNTYGTYGVLAEVTIKILPYIAARGLITVEAHNLDVGNRIFHVLMKESIKVDDILFFDNATIRQLSEHKKLPICNVETPYFLLIDCSSFSVEMLHALMEKIRRLFREVIHDVISIEQFSIIDEVEKRLAWREEIYTAIEVSAFHQKVEVVTLPPAKIGLFLADLSYVQRDFGVEFFTTGSLADGLVSIHIVNVQDETGLVWNTFQHEIRAKIFDILYVYGGNPLSYYSDEQKTIETHFMGSVGYRLLQQIKNIYDPKAILVPTNSSEGL